MGKGDNKKTTYSSLNKKKEKEKHESYTGLRATGLDAFASFCFGLCFLSFGVAS
jgi:hypothetical protein